MRLTLRRGAALGATALIVAGAIWAVHLVRPPAATDAPAGWSPLPHVVRIEVLNASGPPGAARIGTVLLRHAGLDVVQSRNGDSTMRGLEHNRIIVRGSDTTGVGRIVEVLGGADVVRTPDHTWLVDLTVLLGKGFAPPPEQFSPIR